MKDQPGTGSKGFTRRDVIKTASLASLATAFPGGLFAALASERIRVGVIGCGGRGTGAAADCLRGSDGVELVAMGDLAPDRLAGCRAEMAKLTASNPALAAKYKVTDEKCFTGFDAYKKDASQGGDLP